MKVICIDDKNRPNDIPSTRWIKKDEEYTITAVCFMKIQNIYGCKLAEINNDNLFPYSYFALHRFAISKKEIEDAVNKNELELEEI